MMLPRFCIGIMNRKVQKMVEVILILCNSHGDDSCGEWNTETVQIPEDMRDRASHDEVAEWVGENLDVIGHDCMFCGVMEWTPLT